MSLDLDEDDEQVAHALGQPEQAAGYRRLVATFGPLCSAVALAAPAEAATVGRRHGFSTQVVPNAVRMPTRCGAGRPRRTRGVRLLFVGNLTYLPNIQAARCLVEDVLPRLRRALDRPVAVTLVGDVGSGGLWDGPRRRRGVRIAGFVPDLAPLYARADAVVAPIAVGGGTRIKLLEAFAFRVPVVTTPPGAAGLEVIDNQHLLLAETAEDVAGQVVRVITDPVFAESLADAAAELVGARYSYGAVVPRVRAFLAEAAAAAEGAT